MLSDLIFLKTLKMHYKDRELHYANFFNINFLSKHCRNAFQKERVPERVPFFGGTRQERMPLKSERNEAGTNASRSRGTPKGTDRSFSVPFASKFGEKFQDFHKIYVVFVFYWVFFDEK